MIPPGKAAPARMQLAAEQAITCPFCDAAFTPEAEQVFCGRCEESLCVSELTTPEGS